MPASHALAHDLTICHFFCPSPLCRYEEFRTLQQHLQNKHGVRASLRDKAEDWAKYDTRKNGARPLPEPAAPEPMEKMASTEVESEEEWSEDEKMMHSGSEEDSSEEEDGADSEEEMEEEVIVDEESEGHGEGDVLEIELDHGFVFEPAHGLYEEDALFEDDFDMEMTTDIRYMLDDWRRPGSDDLLYTKDEVYV